MPNDTPPGRLGDYLLGDLGVALRHLERIKLGLLKPVPGVMQEIERSITDCVKRIKRDLADQCTNN